MKNAILKATVIVALVLLAVSICSMDSGNMVLPGSMMLSSIGYLALFAKVNERRWK